MNKLMYILISFIWAILPIMFNAFIIKFVYNIFIMDCLSILSDKGFIRGDMSMLTAVLISVLIKLLKNS